MTSSTPKPLRVVVTGATGNVGTSVMRRLAEEPRVVSALGLARRTPRLSYPGVEWAACDLTAPEAPDRLLRLFEGADAVVHLAWRFQPTRDAAVTWEANVLGSLRVFEAAATVGVPALVHASSVGAYAPGPADGHRVDESWPTHGWPGAAYTREKAYLERVLDTFERDHLDTRVVRMRPAFLFKESAAGEQLRIFGHRLLPGRLLRPDLLPVLPGVRGLRFQALHTDDAADAYARAVVQEVRGPFNLAADPVIDGQVLAALLESRSVELPPALPRAALSAGWRLRALGASPGLFDAVLRLPLLDTARARAELGWSPEHSATEALDAFLRGVRSHGGPADRAARRARTGRRLSRAARRRAASPWGHGGGGPAGVGGESAVVRVEPEFDFLLLVAGGLADLLQPEGVGEGRAEAVDGAVVALEGDVDDGAQRAGHLGVAGLLAGLVEGGAQQGGPGGVVLGGGPVLVGPGGRESRAEGVEDDPGVVGVGARQDDEDLGPVVGGAHVGLPFDGRRWSAVEGRRRVRPGAPGGRGSGGRRRPSPAPR
ncbi:hypothetical protein MTP02_46040 [Streptomyces albus]|nr:hypothetical protein MTP02_46040 [Streptomyces albus]